MTNGINKTIKKELREKNKAVINDVQSEDNIAVGLEEPYPVEIEGNVGDFFGALNSGAQLRLKGNAGRFAGNMMCDGEIVIHGHVGNGLGFGLYGGVLVVRGDAGNQVGQMNKGGTIIVDGDVKDNVGLFSLEGDIVITGSAGGEVGEWIIKGNIYVGKGIDALGHNAEFEEMAKEGVDKLKSLFEKYGIEADPSKFQKVVPEELRPFYKTKDVKEKSQGGGA